MTICGGGPGLFPRRALPELVTLNRKKIATLVGLAPFNRDSGKMKGKRAIWGGRGDVSAILYMGTVAAVRLNPSMRTFYERLRAAGKNPKMALTACIRKFIVMLNVMRRPGNLWSPEGREPIKLISGRYLDLTWSLWRQCRL